MKNNEIEFVKSFMLKDFFFKSEYEKYIKDNKISFEETIDTLLGYVFESDFDPYLDKEYQDIGYLKDTKNNIIYNYEDMYMEYIEILQEESR